MNGRETAQMMLDLAKEDLDALQRMLPDPGFSERVFGFHAQQAVEKALKAWLTVLNAEYPKTHDLEALVELLENRGAAIPSEVEALLDLSAFAAKIRYETAPGFYDPLDRREVVTLVARVVAHVDKGFVG